jgi:glycosyltransferase involved in cell wall biosynthesis
MSLLQYLTWAKHPVLSAIFVLLAVVVVVQCVYFLFVFVRLAFFKYSQNTTNASPSVSIVICARNELANLQELLPILLDQDYKNFDIIIAIDRSNDGSAEYIRDVSLSHKKIKCLEIEKDYDHVTPKKYALTAAIRSSDNEVVLLTDADCRPASNQWLTLMADKLSDQKQIVLGFSPYYNESGFLNRLIRFETFYVALQYLSFALAGQPYMGVGRNLMYRRELFIANKGYYTHLGVMGGDDDLLMNEIATPNNTAICIDPDSFCYSIPKQTWAEWLAQKKRHLSVSKHYKSKNKIILGLLSASQVLSWVLLGCFSIGFLVNYPLTQHILWLGLSVFFIPRLLQWLVLIFANNKLGNTIGWYAMPLMDFVLHIYYIVMACVMWVNRKTKITWR